LKWKEIEQKQKCPKRAFLNLLIKPDLLWLAGEIS